jgi:ribosomal protein S18 acetylase RimI-like enzyme
MDVKLRKLTKPDLEELEELFTKTIQEEFPEYTKNTRDYFADKKYKNQIFRSPVKLGAYKDNELVAYLLAAKPVGGVMFIWWLAVLREHKRKGIGTKLIKHLEKKGLKLGAHNIQLQADERNLAFYKAVGFEILGLDKKSFFGADSYVLKKLIQEPKEDTWFK